MRSAIEIGDFNAATDDLNDFHTIGIPHEMEPTVAVLMGRLAEGLGRKEDALAAYRTAADSWDRPAAAQGRLRETVLRYQLGDLKRDAVISELESLDHDLARRTRPRSKRSKIPGASVTPRTAAIATPFYVHAQRQWRRARIRR